MCINTFFVVSFVFLCYVAAAASVYCCCICAIVVRFSVIKNLWHIQEELNKQNSFWTLRVRKADNIYIVFFSLCYALISLQSVSFLWVPFVRISFVLPPFRYFCLSSSIVLYTRFLLSTPAIPSFMSRSPSQPIPTKTALVRALRISKLISSYMARTCLRFDCDRWYWQFISRFICYCERPRYRSHIRRNRCTSPYSVRTSRANQ